MKATDLHQHHENRESFGPPSSQAAMISEDLSSDDNILTGE
jgi:hypothetical protein